MLVATPSLRNSWAMLSPGHAPAFGKPAGCPRPEGILQRVGLVPSTSPFADPTLRSVQRTRYLLRAPVRMSMRDLDKLRTPSESLWSPMGLDQELELTKLLRSQQERTLGALTRHTAPPCMRDHHDYEPYSLLEHITQSSLFLGEALRTSARLY